MNTKVFLVVIILMYCLGCPTILRSDYGTENTVLASYQMALRDHHDDCFSGEKSYRFGRSTTNTVNLMVINIIITFN